MKLRLAILFLQGLLITQSFAQIQFLPWQNFPVGSNANVVAIGDLNNDGLNDVAIATGTHFVDPPNDFKLNVFYQDASGTLATPVKYPYPVANANPVSCIALGDLNNDQLKDVLIGYSDSIGIFYQNSSGSLNPVVSFYSGYTVDGVKTGDLNNDGLTDIAVIHTDDGFIKVFYQLAGGGFSVTSYPTLMCGYSEVDIGDVNNDGLNDVVFMTGQFYLGFRVYLQNASGTLNGPVTYNNTYPITGCLNGIAIADLNNDGRADVVGGGGDNATVRVGIWYQDSITHLMQSPVILIPYTILEALEVADLNNDSKNEIVAIHNGFIAGSLFEQDSNGNYNAYQTFTIPYASHYKPQGLSIGDINNDGKKDIAIASYGLGLVLLYNSSTILSSNEYHFSGSNDITVLPNPFTDKIQINISSPQSNSVFHIKIIDMEGREIVSYKGALHTLDLESLKKGIYTLILENKNRIYFKKIVKI